MKTKHYCRPLCAAALLAAAAVTTGCSVQVMTPQQLDAVIDYSMHEHRMAWWRDARFGMFIHWGLYAIPAGNWNGKTSHGEWIRDTGQIPLAQYDQFAQQFNPQKFNADEWVRIAGDAGMRYLVVTSKHHDGFCLFDTKYTDFNVRNTPFKRDIMKELADACRRSAVANVSNVNAASGAVKFCMYHSIMDWHHPDYMPRRPWEKEQRPEAGADFEKYNTYMKNQVTELLTNYGPVGLLWFDGQWEGTWNNDRGRDLQAHVRSVQPSTIVNNRVGRGGGQYGMDDTHGGRIGDYSTPEQFIPDKNLGVDWETCMTMNGHWGYNAADKDFKTTDDLIRKLCDIASKGGNFLLNVGPTADGEIPVESVQRLKEIGVWMNVNALSIHGTQGSPLAEQPSWGRITMKTLANGNTRLYLHVFDRPADGKLVIPGVLSGATSVAPLAKSSSWKNGVVKHEARTLSVPDTLVIDVPQSAMTDSMSTVLALDIKGELETIVSPTFESDTSIFVVSLAVNLQSPRNKTEVRYTLDGRDPVASDPVATQAVVVDRTTTLAARCFRHGVAIGPVVKRTYTKVVPKPAMLSDGQPGLNVECYEGDFNKLPDVNAMTPSMTGVAETISLKEATSDDTYALRFTGYIRIPHEGVYTFYLSSDDGSRMWLDGDLLVDNDGLHSQLELSAPVALQAGLHAIRVEMFEKSGGAALELHCSGPDMPKQRVPNSAFFRP